MAEKSIELPCFKCGSKCCRYIAVEIERPRTKTDFDHIRWYLLHKSVNVFIDHDKKWFIEFRTNCESLTDRNRCRIYPERPKICRDHGDNEYQCEYFDNPYRKYFSTVDEFQEYLESKKIDWKFKRI